MGIERTYQAIPADSDLLDRVRARPELGEWLPIAMCRFRRADDPGGAPPIPELLELEEIVTGLLAAQPSLADRNCYLDRRWDQIGYLLDAHFGDGQDAARSLCRTAVRGEIEVADHARGGQGHPVRHTAPPTVARIAALLRPLTWEQLSRHHNPPAMEAADVYKADARDAERRDEERRYLGELFGRFRQVYLDAAAHGDMVVVTTD